MAEARNEAQGRALPCVGGCNEGFPERMNYENESQYLLRKYPRQVTFITRLGRQPVAIDLHEDMLQFLVGPQVSSAV